MWPTSSCRKSVYWPPLTQVIWILTISLYWLFRINAKSSSSIEYFIEHIDHVLLCASTFTMLAMLDMLAQTQCSCWQAYVNILLLLHKLLWDSLDWLCLKAFTPSVTWAQTSVKVLPRDMVWANTSLNLVIVA